jgi:hypothetical protein
MQRGRGQSKIRLRPSIRFAAFSAMRANGAAQEERSRRAPHAGERIRPPGVWLRTAQILGGSSRRYRAAAPAREYRRSLAIACLHFASDRRNDFFASTISSEYPQTEFNNGHSDAPMRGSRGAACNSAMHQNPASTHLGAGYFRITFRH